MMDVICARHGNTFAAGDRVVFIGRNENMPLTEKGEAQARALAAALARARVAPAAVFCGGLARTRRYADLVAEGIALPRPPVTDERLNEIDYGAWAGLTNEEVESKLGQGEDLRLWNEAGVWPRRAGWGDGEAAIRSRVADFLEMVRRDFAPADTVLVVSSNGVLRYFALAVLGAEAGRYPRFPFKMRTGNIGKIHDLAGRATLAFWDAAPGSAPL